MSNIAVKTTPGLIGSATGVALSHETVTFDLTLAIAVAVSVLFGIASALTREPDAKARRKLVFNAGALWIAAFWLAAKISDGNILDGAVIGLSVSLAGAKALEPIERFSVAAFNKLSDFFSAGGSK